MLFKSRSVTIAPKSCFSLGDLVISVIVKLASAASVLGDIVSEVFLLFLKLIQLSTMNFKLSKSIVLLL